MHLKTLLVISSAALAASGPVYPRAAPQVEADLATISSQISSMDAAIKAYTGGIAAAAPIESAALTLESDIQTAITDTNNSPVFTAANSQVVTTDTCNLSPLIAQTLADLIIKQPLAQAAGLDSLVVSDLNTLKSLTDSLSTAIKAKVTTANAATISSCTSNIDADFAAAIAAYS